MLVGPGRRRPNRSSANCRACQSGAAAIPGRMGVPGTMPGTAPGVANVAVAVSANVSISAARCKPVDK
jgi:hypothetical protein